MYSFGCKNYSKYSYAPYIYAFIGPEETQQVKFYVQTMIVFWGWTCHNKSKLLNDSLVQRISFDPGCRSKNDYKSN